MAPTPEGTRPRGSEESWAWAHLDPEIRTPLASRVDRELAARSMSGALVYFIVCVVLAVSTPYYRDHPHILLASTGSTLLLGTLRIWAARDLKKPLFLFTTYGTFLVWGAFCAWTLQIYAGQWTSMILLLSTAALAGGASSSLAPNRRLAVRCLVVLIGPTIVSAITLGDRRHWGLGGLAALYLGFLLSQARDNWRAFWGASVAAEKEKIRGTAERRKAEQERVILVAAIEQAAEEILITNIEGNIEYCNPAFERVTGYSRGEVLGKNPRFLRSDRHSEDFYENRLHTIKSGRVWSGRVTNRKRDGTLYEVEGTISPIFDATGKLTGFVSAWHDVTETLQLEAQLRQAQKMESIGRLAGGVAHDFNNLLTVISGYGDMLQKGLPPDDPLQRYIEGVKKASDSAANLTQQLLAFSRKQIIQPRPVDLNALITDTSELLRSLVGEDIELVSELDPSLGRVIIDPEQTIHILMNLAANARDAMQEGGRLTVQTSNVPEADTPPLAKMRGAAVRLSVTDTGAGMDEETRQHIFEPFFTTKQKGRGTGLGLSMVYGIVQQSGGWIEVESASGRGTAFHLYFPHSDQTAAAGQVPAGKSSSRGGSETILVVEDLQEIRTLIAQVLELHGFRILSAASGEEALRKAQEYQGVIDLLLTDVIMPGMTGKQVAGHLLSLRPGIKVLYMTGYSWEVIADRGVLQQEVPYLPKPFTPDTLVTKVRQVLGPPPDKSKFE